jgi:integrase
MARAAGSAGRHPCWDPQHYHGLRHSFVAILVAAGCNIREASEWAGHNSVAFTLTRYGGLFEDGSDGAVDRLDVLLGGVSKTSDNVFELSPGKRSESRKSPGADSGG